MKPMYYMLRTANGHIVNHDEVAGIHYGVIHQNQVMMEALDDVCQNGTDIHYEHAEEDFKTRVYDLIDDKDNSDLCKELLALKRDWPDTFIDDLVDVIMDESDAEDMRQAACCFIDDEFGQHWYDDTPSYSYDKDGYQLRYNTDSGYVMLSKSPYYTMARECSPCYPNAGDVGTTGELKTYCFGPDWFEQGEIPCDIYDVATGKLVVKAEVPER